MMISALLAEFGYSQYITTSRFIVLSVKVLYNLIEFDFSKSKPYQIIISHVLLVNVKLSFKKVLKETLG